MTPGPNYTGQHDLFAAARPAAVMEVAAAVLIHPSPAKPAPVLEPPATRPRRDHALLVQVLGRSGDMCSDAPRVASELLNRFGDLRRTMTADVPDLASIAGDAAARDLRLSYDLALALLQQPLRERDVISSWEALKRYLVAALSGRTREAFHVLFLDGANRLVADEKMGEGTVNTAPVYPREVVRRALQLEVSNLILVHNHPSVTDSPSRHDQQLTKDIVAAAKTMGIGVHDHVIVAGDQLVSLRSLGMM